MSDSGDARNNPKPYLSSTRFTHESRQFSRSDIARDIVQQAALLSSRNRNCVLQVPPGEDVCCRGRLEDCRADIRARTSSRFRLSALLLIVRLSDHLSSARTLLEKRHSRVECRSSVELGRSEQNGEESNKEDTDDTKVLKERISVDPYAAERSMSLPSKDCRSSNHRTSWRRGFHRHSPDQAGHRP